VKFAFLFHIEEVSHHMTTRAEAGGVRKPDQRLLVNSAAFVLLIPTLTKWTWTSFKDTFELPGGEWVHLKMGTQ
jgi:hypothetical protein